MKHPQPSELLSCACKAALAAGRHAKRNWRRRTEKLALYRHDVKLKLDVECQERAMKIIHSRFPDHAVLGEEKNASLVRANGSPWLWVIDPIDGTVNFSHGLPLWCCSVAVRFRDETIAGVVYAPMLGELYTASSDSPACLNGTRIRVSNTDKMDMALILTGLDKNAEPGKKPFAFFERISKEVQRSRILGSAALDICMVACGRADGYFETGIYLWDIAAADLIVRSAGGAGEILRDFGEHRLNFVASNGIIHPALKMLVATNHKPASCV